MKRLAKLPEGFAVEETIDGRWIVLCNGLQYGTAPYDASGASSQTWVTKDAAIAAVIAREEAYSLLWSFAVASQKRQAK